MTQWLIDSFLATSGLLLLVLLLRSHVARIFGPSVAYWLWLLPALRLFMPPLIQQTVPSPANPANDIIRDAVYAAAGQAGAGNPMAAANPYWIDIDWAGLAILLWLGGAALLFIVQMMRYLALRDEILADANEIDRIGNIRLIETSHIDGPLAFGLLRRYIAVPRYFMRNFSEQERRLALAHEVAHHRSGDLYMNLAAFIFLCLQWFNPLAWLGWHAFRFDQESACDARILAGADIATRQDYGRTLARAATLKQLPKLAVGMAFNRPSSIIKRLRRLMMKDISKTRLLTGRLAIFAAIAAALPLTATVIPVFAQEEAKDAAADGKVEKKKSKILIIKTKDGNAQGTNVSGNEATPFVKTIQKDGKTIVVSSSEELKEAEIEKLIAEAEKSAEQAEVEAGDTDEPGHLITLKLSKNLDDFTIVDNNYPIKVDIPEVKISELQGKCKDGQRVTVDVGGAGNKKSAITKLVLCGRVEADAARLQAIAGLREARADVAQDKDIPENIRLSVLKSLDKQIDRVKKEISSEAGSKN